MINFKVSSQFAGGLGALERALINTGRPRVNRLAHTIGETGQNRVLENAIATTKPRNPGRSRSSSLRDGGWVKYEVDNTSDGVELVFSVEGDDLFMAKFFSLNFGSGGHPIYPHGNYKLVFPFPTEDSPERGFTQVYHPGTSGRHFYEQGIREALAAIPRRL